MRLKMSFLIPWFSFWQCLKLLNVHSKFSASIFCTQANSWLFWRIVWWTANPSPQPSVRSTDW
jgi:hypothetical protein